MKIISPKAEIIDDNIDWEYYLKKIEKIGRTCYKSEGNITDDSCYKFCKMLINNGHEAMLEHAPTISVRFTVDRGISHEIVRHRLFSFAQESQRYVDYSKDKNGKEVTFINLKDAIPYDKKMSKLLEEDKKAVDAIMDVWTKTVKTCEDAYKTMIELGATPQFARGVLPNSTKTEIIVTGNVREWRNFFKLRVHPSAHPQMREVVCPLLKKFNENIPVLFEDIL